ncbi:MAG TPA: diguanylate cyclase [Xanthomonadaceae bacterium]|nr:diguanylate cyclase [Xanthomonadaceae bacterium]
MRARNLALANQFDASLAMVRELLDRQVSDALRLRTLILGINISTDSADLSRAFAWLHEGLVLLDNVDHAHPRLLGVASYLYLRAGEEEGALDYARRSLELARKLGDSRSECVALSDLGHALKDAGRHSEAMPIRHLQVAACDEVGDPVFVADGYRGIGQSLVRLGRANEALRWLNDAINRFDDTGYGRGAREARLVLAEALYESGADPLDALGLLETLTPDFEADSSWTSIETARRLWSRIEEARGRHQEALTHVRLAQEARTRIDQEARARRLSFLQVQFDTRLKEHQIALLDSERERQAAELEARRRTQWLQAMGLGGLVVAAGLLALMLGRSRSERRRFRRLSEIDGLTGLSNHQHTRYCGQVAYERAMRDLSPFTAVVADIDRFKRINDRYGHATGDAVLRRLGELVREVFPERAVKGRTGGEEFTVLIDANAAQTRFLIDDLRRRIAPIEVFGHHVEYRLSFGLSEANENHAALEDLLHAADMALYQAKRSGRDRVMDAAYLPEVRRHEPGLVVVGSGIQLGRHLSQRCLSEIEEAEKVLAVTDAAAFAMIQDIRPDVIDLRSHYAEGKDRRQTYREMDEAIMAEVRAGYRVCVVFYGHPGVFADVPHAVIRKAREAGFSARMEPGISADACLYADLGIDPGRHGVLSLEATQFLVEDRQLDSRSLVLLWQVALTGDLACTRFHAEPDQLAHLVDRLLLDYPPNHEVILYEAAHLPIQPFRAERLSLSELPRAHYKEYTTLVIPPRTDRAPNLASQLRETLRQAGSANEGARREGEDTRDRHE